jgi:hypothetical protein
MKNLEERCAELGITLVESKTKKNSITLNNIYECVPKVWPKCKKLKVTTEELLNTCKNTKIFYHRLRKYFWDVRCEQCKTKRILPFKTNTNYQKID